MKNHIFSKKVLTSAKQSLIITSKVINNHATRKVIEINLAEIRKRCGLKQSDISGSLGIDRSTVAKWETKKSAPRADIIPKLAEILNCSIDELFKIK